MGKSRKKTPVIKDNGRSKKKNKTIANKTVRSKLKDPEFSIANGNAYKKEFESYNIADYVCYWTKEEAIHQYETSTWINKKQYPTLESWLTYWRKCVINK